MPLTAEQISLDVNASEIRRLLDLARMISQAEGVELSLRPHVADRLLEVLTTSGIPARSDAGGRAPTGNPAQPYRMDGFSLHASDTLMAAVPVLGSNGSEMATIELARARPDLLSGALSAQLREVAKLLASRLSEGMVQRPGMPRVMLALIEELAERDSDAGSRLVSGFLHLISGQVPSKVETTRLLLAGLAEPVEYGPNMPFSANPALRMTEEADAVLRRVRLSLAADNTGTPARAAEEVRQQDIPAVDLNRKFQPLAHLKMGNHSFDIAESDDETVLAWRPTSSRAGWRRLMKTLSDGWAEIAAEIISSTQNTLRDYTFTHMILQHEEQAGDERHYDLYDMSWKLRKSGDRIEGRVEGVTPDGSWQALGCQVALFQDNPREAAFTALTELLPDLGDRIGEDVTAWVHRLALGATVAPFVMAKSA